MERRVTAHIVRMTTIIFDESQFVNYNNRIGMISPVGDIEAKKNERTGTSTPHLSYKTRRFGRTIQQIHKNPSFTAIKLIYY